MAKLSEKPCSGSEARPRQPENAEETLICSAKRRYSNSMQGARDAMNKAGISCRESLENVAAAANVRYEQTLHAMENARDVASEQYVRVSNEVKGFILFKYEQIPEYLRSEYVISGYRCHYNFWDTFLSLFKIHNESFNIWSHLVGFFIFLGLTIWAYNTWLLDATYAERAHFTIFSISAMIQMLNSTIFHWFGCMGRHTFSAVAKLDYSGICVLIVGSCFPVLYHIFQCRPNLMVFYMGLMTILGGITLTISWLPWFDAPQYSTLRALTFIGLGCAGVVMLPHFFYMNPVPVEMLIRLGVMASLYIGGAVRNVAFSFLSSCKPSQS